MINLLKLLININNYIFRCVGVKEKFFTVGLLLLPMDSFPLFPTSNVYRPISFFPILIYWILDMSKKMKLSRFDVNVLLIYFLAFIYTCICAYSMHDDLSGLIKFTINGVILFIVASSSYRFLTYLIEKGINIGQYVAKVLIISSILPLLLGWIQLFSRFGIIPVSLAEIFTGLFSYRIDVSRIQFLSGEPSMGFRYVSMVAIFVLFFYNENKKLKYFLLSNYLILLAFSGSTFGYLFLILLLLFHNVVFNKIKLVTILKITFTMCMAYLIMPIAINNLPEYTAVRLGKIFELVLNFSLEAMIIIANSDGSFFLRIFNPIIGFLIAWENYLFGIGGEYYHLHYIDIVSKYYPFALNFSSVAEVAGSHSIITPKSLYGKIVSEFGFAGLLMFLLFLKNKYDSIKKCDLKYKWLFSFTCILVLNSGSYVYINFIFLLVMCIQISNLTKYKNDKKENLQISCSI